MVDWITDIKSNPPSEGVIVEVMCSDARGEFVLKAYRKDYKPGSTKKQLRRKWRWMVGEDVLHNVVEAWRPVVSKH